MSIQTTIAALQVIHRAIDGMQTAPDLEDYPAQLNTADLPMVLIVPGEGTIDLESIAAKKRADTIYRAFVYVAPIAQGTPVSEGLQTAVALMQSLRDAYLTPANISLTTGTYQATLKTASENPIRHSAIAVLSYAGIDYRGFTFDIGVREKW